MRNLLKIFPLIALLGGCAHLGQSEAPHKYGATTAPRVAIVNGSNTPLPSYQFSDMPVGLIVMDTTGQNWQLTASTSAVNHTSVEAVTSNPGLRWLTYSGGGGSGTVTSVAATAGGLLAVAGTPTVAPTVGLAPLAASSFVCNATGGGAVPTACGVGTALSFSGTTLNVPAATDSTAGSLSAADKTTIDGLGTTYVPLTRTLTGTFPIAIAGGNSPQDLSANRAFTFQYTLLNEVISTGSNVTDLPLTTVTWTTNGDTDGGYVYVGQLNIPASSTAFNYSFQPNAVSTNQNGRTAIGNAANSFVGAAVAIMYIGGGTVNAGRMTFRCAFEAKSGRIREMECMSRTFDLTSGAQVIAHTESEWNSTATVVDGTSRIHCDNASGIQAGSFVKVIRTMMAN